MLKLSNIYKTFSVGTVDEKKLFNDFSLDVKKGEFVGVIGSNGSGKTTMLNIVSGDIKPDSGSIILDGCDISKKSPHRRYSNIGRVFQDPSVGTCATMTIFENLSIADNKGKPYNLTFGLNKINKDFYRTLLSQLGMGLEDRLETKVGSLSGGQRQALALIMATLNSPKLLLLDEHTAALDPKSSDIVMNLTEKVVNEKGITTLMVTHNLRHAVRYGTRTIMMHDGNIVLDKNGKDKENTGLDEYLRIFNEISIECGN